MTDIEINGIAQGLFLYLKEQCPMPADALAVIICLALIYYERCKIPDADFPIEEFTQKLSADLQFHWKHRTVQSEAPKAVQ